MDIRKIMRTSRSLLIIKLTIGIIFAASGQIKNDEDIFYVLNVSGADLYENSSLDSRIMGKLKVGEMIVASEILRTRHSKKIGEEFYLDGYFIKIRNEDSYKYVFSADLTKFKPVMRDVYKGILIPDINGEKINDRIVKRTEKYGDAVYELEDIITEYENVTYTYTAFDGCFDHIYAYRNLTLSEVYHLLTIHHLNINETELEILFPRFIEKRGNEYLFQGEGATEDLKLTENEDGSLSISSYDCT
ncbi:hypothetical protein [Fulvivirga sedimenti]|uniref:Uncharacterized protein n=1 Tax=Fulvivirga sedimenti TaxID=2879465 RepID=A0A9X1HKD4_9BACT|nr:hypothetical protein [Fulvivirga sedimenti]MCA6073809.1 hypothetical protein [Fulvivirga sedimenti]